jgi:hypothetical protein
MAISQMKPTLPKYKGEWFIIAGLLIVIIASICKSFYPITEPSTITFETWEKYKAQQQAWPFILFDYMESFGFLVLVISSLITGIRSFRKKGISVKAAAFIIIGLGICLINLYTIYISHGISTSVSNLPKPNMELMRLTLSKPELPLTEKSKLSKQYARDRYLYDGIKEQYFTETGKTLIYEPTKDDDKFRESQLLAKKMWENNQKRMPYTLSYWLIVTIAGLLLGVLTPIQKQSQQPN